MAPTLIPDLDELYNCPFYWGKIEEEEAKAVLKDKPFGSYLVKDAEEAEDKIHQIELFFVRKDLSIGKMELYFDSNFVISKFMCVPFGFGVGRIEGKTTFKDFLRKLTEFSPFPETLKYPVLKKRPFSLQELARSSIRKTALSFDGISLLELPENLKKFLKEHVYSNVEKKDTNLCMLSEGIFPIWYARIGIF